MSGFLNALRLLDRKRRLYRRIYATADGKAFIDSLAEFCRYDKDAPIVSDKSGCIDPNALMMAEGRRQVVRHIVKHLGITDMDMQLRLNMAQNNTGDSDHDSNW